VNVEEVKSVLKEQREDAENSVTLVALFQLNETERRAYIISLKG
jgi:hypothetical protein